MKIIGIVIAKENSKRFKGKNYYPVDGLPMFYHSVKLMEKTIDRKDIYVCTDSVFIKNYCSDRKIQTIDRGPNAIDDEQPYFEILKFAYQSINKKADIIVSVLANSIGHNPDAIKNGIAEMIKNKHVGEVRSFDADGNQSGIFLFREYLFKKEIHTLAHMASIKSDGVEIHTREELK